MPVVPLGGFQASVTLDVACACACDNNPTKSNPSTPNAIVRGTRATKLCQAIEGTRITRNIIESCILGDSSAGLLMPSGELEVKVRRPNFVKKILHCLLCIAFPREWDAHRGIGPQRNANACPRR